VNQFSLFARALGQSKGIKSNRFGLKSRTYYDDPPAVPPPSPPPPAVPPPPPPPPVGKTFTQTQVDAMMAEHRRGLQTQNAELAAQIADISAKANLTESQKAELDAKINILQTQHLTEAQKLTAQVEAEKLSKKKLEEDSKKEVDLWRGNYHELLVTNSILSGAQKHEAAFADQMLDMLKPKAKVVSATDEAGNVIPNKYVAKMAVTMIDPKTKLPVTVELPIEDAIGEMRKDQKHGNLFLTGGKPGLGGSGGTGGAGIAGPLNLKNMTAEEYRAQRVALGLAKKAPGT